VRGGDEAAGVDVSAPVRCWVDWLPTSFIGCDFGEASRKQFKSDTEYLRADAVRAILESLEHEPSRAYALERLEQLK
jgi:hypothetical protein